MPGAEELGPLQCRPAVPGRVAGMRRPSAKRTFTAALAAVMTSPVPAKGQGARPGRCRHRRTAVAHEIDLGALRLFRRAAEDADRAGGAASSIIVFSAMAAPVQPAPSMLWPQPWPLVLPLAAGVWRGSGALPSPGSASYSGRKATTGPPDPCVHSLTKAVGSPRCRSKRCGSPRPRVLAGGRGRISPRRSKVRPAPRPRG
jgi:hypothetical protein